MDKERTSLVSDAGREPAQPVVQPTSPDDPGWNDIPDVDPVDQYVIATGEYPPSGGTVGPDVVDDTLLEAIDQPNDRPAAK